MLILSADGMTLVNMANVVRIFVYRADNNTFLISASPTGCDKGQNRLITLGKRETEEGATRTIQEIAEAFRNGDDLYMMEENRLDRVYEKTRDSRVKRKGGS